MTTGDEKLRQYLKRATADLRKTRRRLREVEAHEHEAIAIVGMACRYPGGADSPRALWSLVEAGVDAIGEFPTDRGWDLARLLGSGGRDEGTSSVGEGGFLYDAPLFDAAFFEISPREALAMDPQQRLLLEVSWEALESAGIDPRSLRGSRTGVFAGLSASRYGIGAHERAHDVEGHRLTGEAASVASGRVAYALGLEGPAISVDTACSASLVALHLACRSLRSGECSLALAGGATVMADPMIFVEFTRQQGLAADARCKSFADGADGTSWGEGAGTLLLERLSDAHRHGRRVLALVRGSATNQDGASNGLTAPRGSAQERVIREALADAGLDPEDVDAVEGHGTGTSLGDPIEAQALLATYGQGRPTDRPLWLGSVKSNIGHTQAAAGVASVIKMAMALQHGLLPKSLHVDRPSQQVDWSAGSVSLLAESQLWERQRGPRRAGISSFGISGTNAHVVLEEPPPPDESESPHVRDDERGPTTMGEAPQASGEGAVPASFGGDGAVPWVLSARGGRALCEQGDRLGAFLQERASLPVLDIAASLASRAAFEDRAVVLGERPAELVEGLRALARGETPAGVVGGVVRRERRIAFLFTGQGAQRVGMGRELYRALPVFGEAFDCVCSHMDPHLERPLRDVVFGDGEAAAGGTHANGADQGAAEGPLLDRTAFTQAGLFAFEVALFRQLEAWGVKPDFVTGHSIGEVVAAHVAGVFSLEDACTLVAARGGLMEALPAGGAMIAIAAPEAEVVGALEGLRDRVSIAAVNGPASVVISGDANLVEEVASGFAARGRKTKRLRVSHAFHSPRMEEMLEDFLSAIQGLTFEQPTIPVVSNLTGAAASAQEVCSPAYWVRHVRDPVRFADAIRWLDGQGVSSFLELGPDGVLSAMCQECLEHDEGAGPFGEASTTPAERPDEDSGPGAQRQAEMIVAVPVARRDQPELRSLWDALARVWTVGLEVDWASILRSAGGEPVELPTYAFQRERYWLASAPGAGDLESVGQSSVVHGLLGAALQIADGQGWLFTGRLSVQTQPWLADHVVAGVTLLPGSALLELALHTGRSVGCGSVRELTLHAPLTLPERGNVLVQVRLGEPDDTGAHLLAIHSRLDGGLEDEQRWTLNASGAVGPENDSEHSGESTGFADDSVWPLAQADLGRGQAWPPADADEVDVEELYELLDEGGLDYGPAFRGLRSAWRRGSEVFAEVSLPSEQATRGDDFALHPALLDAALHSLAAAGSPADRSTKGASQRGDRPHVPFAFSGVTLHAPGAHQLRVRLAPAGTDSVSLAIGDLDGRPVASVRSLVLRALAERPDAELDRWMLGVRWLAPEDAVVAMPARIGALTGAGCPCPADVVAAAGKDVDAHEDLDALVRSIETGGAVPELVLASCLPDGGGQLPQAVRGRAERMLALLQAWLVDERLAGRRLALITRGAVACRSGDELSDLAAVAAVGLVRTAQSEHPGRFMLIDLDSAPASLEALPTALSSGEPQLAIRGGEVLAPRLARTRDISHRDRAQARATVPSTQADDYAASPEHEGSQHEGSPFAGEGTVLITGGTGGVGGLLARHLVAAHGVRSLTLVGRRGREASGAAQLERDLESLGAKVKIAACDVANREQLATLLESLTAAGRVRAVVHAAGLLDDGVIESLTPERLGRVLAPKVDGAWYLHELTEHLDLSAFVLFSSAAGVLGNAGQGNYGAANTFLDALAEHRRARGLPGVSLAWGPWAQANGMVGELDHAALARIARSGMSPLSEAEALGLFDLASNATDDAVTVLARLDPAALREQARAGTLPTLLRGLLRTASVAQSTPLGTSLAARVRNASAQERPGLALELVCNEVAAVLGHASARTVDPERPFKELGFDSLTAVELRNRLGGVTGMGLPATLIFDHPTPAALAGHMLEKLVGRRAVAALPARPAMVEEPVAIVGMACRYPGGVACPADLWRLVSGGQDAISGFPVDRGWDLERLFDDDPESVGTSYVREAGFLHEAGEFDAHFFGIGPREARAMDPQQRLLLELSWEALEDAGIDPTSLKGSRAGVFAGVMYHDYGAGQDLAADDGYLSLSGAGSVVSGRVAYTFGLEGPAVTVDTACSSSLVAMHLACQSLRSGESSLALAGGVTVMGTPQVFVGFSRQRGLAPDGRCKSFAQAADGVSWSEGVGILVLEPLSEALRRGRRVWGLVRGSAVNQDGASNGLTAPNGPSQRRVILEALANAGVSPQEVDAVEGHGTGTTLGDPIEAQALLETYGAQRPADRPLRLGSLKSNIGHAQAAAGVGGVIKMAMALRHGVLPKTLHVDEPSREVDWSAGAVSLLSEAQLWSRNGHPRRAGVSSFGISGTNAHVILEEAPPSTAVAVPAVGEPPATIASGHAVPWVLSSKSEEALSAQAGRLLELVQGSPELSLADVGRSLAARAGFEHRAVVVGGSRERLLSALGALARGDSATGLVRGLAGRTGGQRGQGLAFVFPGQGAQWDGMASDLLECSPLFASRIRACAQALAPHVDWSLEDVLRKADGAPDLDRVDVVQPALFAVMVSLAGLWQAYGVAPSVVIGHSQGEIAAAHIAGALSLEEAARISALRGLALVPLAGKGGMVSVELGAERLASLVKRWDGMISIAAVNGPSTVVVSGEAQALDELLRECANESVRARKIPVSYAAHSAQVDAIGEALLRDCETLAPRPGELSMCSTVTGAAVDTSELDGRYWYRNLRETVLFEQATRVILQEGCRAFVEISPHPVLAAAIDQTAAQVIEDSTDVLITGSLRRDQVGSESFLASLAHAWAHGVEVDWSQAFAGSDAGHVELPTYAFQRRRYWLAAQGGARAVAFAGLAETGHPLLAGVVELAGSDGVVLTGRLSLATHGWLSDHAAMGVVLLPGAALVELALHAGARVGAELLAELTLHEPLTLDEQGSRQLQVSLGEPDEEGRRAVHIHSRPESPHEGVGEHPWTCHASGTLVRAQGLLPSNLQQRSWDSLAGAWPPADAEPIELDGLYEQLAARGLDYGPGFQGLQAAWRRGDELFGEVQVPEEPAALAASFAIHPVLLDAALHVAAAGPVAEERQGSEHESDAQHESDAPATVPLPFCFTGVGIGQTSIRSAARVALRTDRQGGVSLAMADDAGEPVAWIDSLAMREVGAEQLSPAREARHDCLYELRWSAITLHGSSHATGRLALLGEQGASMHRRLIDAADGGVDLYPDIDCLAGAVDDGAPVPGVVLADCACDPHDGELPGAAHALAARTLAIVQAWLADERLAGSRLALITHGAVAVGDGEDVVDLAGASLWGLVRSAQAEHPGRLLLVDIDEHRASVRALTAAFGAGESELGLREGAILVSRIANSGVGDGHSGDAGELGLGRTGTVLITGGTGGLGGRLARHLVERHGVRHLLLVSRSGPDAPGASQLQADLAGLGAVAELVACDVADRARLQELIRGISAQRPLIGVVHAAGVVDDGLVSSLTPERLERVLTPKLDAAWHLHELTSGMDLSAFVLFSSASGVLGAPGQGNYALANAFLDGLAAHRCAKGLPAVSMAWGYWSETSAMTSHLSREDLARMARSGMGALLADEGLELFDLACSSGRALVLPMRLELVALRAQARLGTISGRLQSLVRVRPRQASSGSPGSFARRLGAAGGERERIVDDLVRAEVAVVLGHESAAAIELDGVFKDIGFDSLMAVELRNRIAAATGVQLAATLVFDYPTPRAVAAHVLDRVGTSPAGPSISLDGELADLERRLAAISGDRAARAKITNRLKRLVAGWEAAQPDGFEDEDVAAASADEVFDLIDRELGPSSLGSHDGAQSVRST
ncbi:MAG TPA: SDR family NAD(P)-dependent oxidoreductase [Solirubrobacteraceae bacterium]|jgi:acyl transferase domain-containing protein/short-subunit dehydrogenase/acyl carrier protein|nr:SDR family NAD(P)-dependent oxidoreductase [Solirubrobacteraceae bacterium]